MNETEGILAIHNYLKDDISPTELDIAKKIMTTMSYSTVKKVGFPNLGEYQEAYHIVREADLLTAYDFDRCMIYNMHCKNGNIFEAYNDASELFQKRVFKHNDDNLFITNYSKLKSRVLHMDALSRMYAWQRMMRTPLV